MSSMNEYSSYPLIDRTWYEYCSI